MKARIVDWLWRLCGGRRDTRAEVDALYAAETQRLAQERMQQLARNIAEHYGTTLDEAADKLRAACSSDVPPLRVVYPEPDDTLPCDVPGCAPKREPRGAFEWDAAYRHFVEHTQ